MSDLLKDITLENINRERGKEYKPIKYSFIVSDGSIETDADRVRDASNVYLGKFALDNTAGRLGFSGLNLGIPGQDIVAWAANLAQQPSISSTIL